MPLNEDTGPITIAHDYFTQRGGAERVAAALVNALEPRRVITAMHEPARTFDLGSAVGVSTSFLQQVELFRTDPRRAFPALPIAWGLLKPVREGVVICSSSGWSHSIRTAGNARKVVYCHNPARWLYQPNDYFKDQSKLIRLMAGMIRPLLLRWDQKAAQSADLYVANSSAVAARVRRFYGREPVVLYPPISIDVSGPQEAPEVADGYFVTVGRGRGYKNVDLLVKAFERLPDERLIVVGVTPKGLRIPDNVQFVTRPSDAQLLGLYSHALALVSVSHEDFGLTPLEANAMGTPALVLRSGGFLDSLDEGVSGQFIDREDVAMIVDAVRTFPRSWDADAVRRHAQRFSVDSFVQRLIELISQIPDQGVGAAAPRANQAESDAA